VRATHTRMAGAASCNDFSQEYPVTIKDPTSRSARTFSPRWRGTAAVCAGTEKSRSTTATAPRTRSTGSPFRKLCSTRSHHRSAAVLIIISDEPLVEENQLPHRIRPRVLSDQPQGGFITRAPSPSTAIARAGQDDSGYGNGWYGSPGYAQPQIRAIPRRPVLLSAALVVRPGCGLPSRSNDRRRTVTNSFVVAGLDPAIHAGLSSMDPGHSARRSITSDLCRAQGFGPRRRVQARWDEKRSPFSPAWRSRAIKSLLHRQGVASM